MKQTTINSLYPQVKNNHGKNLISFDDSDDEGLMQMKQKSSGFSTEKKNKNNAKKSITLRNKASEPKFMVSSITEQPTAASTVVVTKKRIEALDTTQASKNNNVSKKSTQKRKKSGTTKKRKIDEISGDQGLKETKSTKKRKLNEANEAISDEIELKSTEDVKEEVKEMPKKQQAKQALNKSIIGGLSANTLKHIQKALKPTVKKEETIPQRKSSRKSQLEQEFTFSQLDPKEAIEETPKKAKPFNLKELSGATQNVIDDILNDPFFEKKPSPRKSYKDLQNQDLSMKLKHEQLLSVTREIVLPAHYKKLLDLQKFLDNSLNFMKQCRSQGGNFDILKRSIEQTHGKDFDVSDFKQIMYIAPEFYSHKWEQISSQRDQKLFIDFPNEAEPFMTQDKLDERYQTFKQRLIERVKKYHDKFIEQLKQKKANPASLFEIDINLDNFDPLEAQQWHYKFDPHEVEKIPQVDLKPQAKQIRSESVKDFLNRSNINTAQPTLVQKALEKSAIFAQKGNSPDRKEMQKLEEWSKRTGLSIETLRQIQAKSSAIKESKDNLNKTIGLEDSQKKLQTLIKLSEMIRSTFGFKGKQTLSLNELIGNLNDNQRGNFQSKGSIHEQIDELGKLVPEWLQVKVLPGGKFVRCTPSIQSHQVQVWLRERIQRGNENQNQPMMMID